MPRVTCVFFLLTGHYWLLSWYYCLLSYYFWLLNRYYWLLLVTSHYFWFLVLVPTNELVVKVCFKYSEFSLAVISWLIADKNCSMFQFFFPYFRLIYNFIVYFSNITGANKGRNVHSLFLNFLTLVHCFLWYRAIFAFLISCTWI